MPATLARRIAALIALAALLIGAPFGLWKLGRSLLPQHVPNISRAWDALMSRDTGAVFMGALVVVGFVAWAIFAVCVALEILSRLTGRGRTWRIPGLRLPQSAARSLIGAVLAGTVMLAAATAAGAHTLPPLPHAAVTATSAAAAPSRQNTVAAHRDGRGAIPRPPVARAAPRTFRAAGQARGPIWVVGKGDTLWAIAQRTLGNPMRYNEIVELNRSVTQPDGGRLVSSDTWIEDGWTLQLPADAKLPAAAAVLTRTTAAPHTVTVQPGNTLSQIAQDQLGSADRYPELARANHLADPNQIDVGQRIVIPAHVIASSTGRGGPVAGLARKVTPPRPPSTGHTSTGGSASRPGAANGAGGGGRTSEPSAPVTTTAAAQPGSTSSSPAPATTSAASSASAAGSSASAAAATTAQPTEASGHETISPATTIPAHPTEQRAQAAADHNHSGIEVPALAGISLLAAAAGWGALLAARRRGNRRRRPGRQAAAARLSAVRTEKALRERAANIDDSWLDLALRSLGSNLAAHRDSPDPDIVAAYLTSEQLRLQLATAVPAPAPFHADGNNWILPADADLPLTPVTAVDHMAPLPTLASIGARGEETVLLDLERAGAITLKGDPTACHELMNHLVVELAHNGWSDGLAVSLVGWGTHLIGLNPDRLTHLDTLTAATRELRARIQETQQSQEALDTDVLAGRILDIAGDSWMPQVLLVDAANAEPEHITELQELLHELVLAGRATTAVVLTGADPADDSFEAILSGDGQLQIPHLWGTERIRAARLTDHEIAELGELFTLADRVDEPVPPATETAHWAQNMDASGALIDPPADTPAAEAADPSITAEQAPTKEIAPASVVQIRPVSSAAAALLAAALAADPHLDGDLTEWAGPETARPRIGLLGPVTVAGPGTAPVNRIARLSEVVTYLALETGGVSADKFVTDLWPPDRQPAAGTRRQLIFDVRKWMGRHPETGEQFVPNANDGLYVLTDRLMDVDLLRRLRKRAQAKAAAADPVGALEDYTAALRLVRGPALPEARGQAYMWLANLDRMDDRHIPAWVTDTAHEAAQIALTMHDLDTARWAADIGNTTDPDSDVPLCDLLQVAQSAGNIDTARALAWQILELNSVEVPEDLAPHTCEIINNAFPAGLRAVGSPA